MKISLDQKYSVYRVLILITLILFVSAGGGLNIVWLKNQIAISSERTENFRVKYHGFERRVHALEAQIATLHNPENLKARSQRLNLQLQAPGERQIVRFRVAEVERVFVSDAEENVDIFSSGLAFLTRRPK
jgi:hypothetical protein